MKLNKILFKLIAAVFALSMTASFASPEMSAAGRAETEKALKDFYVENHGYDPLINAQDFARENIPTIRVESEGGRWYKVTYRDSYSNKPVEIHLKAKGRTGHLRLLDFK